MAVGIDLGTTNSVVSVERGGQAVPLADPQGFTLIPSVVSFPPQGAVVVGRAAAELRVEDPARTVYSVKRVIGRTWSSPEVQKSRPKLSYELRQGPNDAVLVAVGDKTYAPPEISAFVLRHAKAVAEQATGDQIRRAVVTVPANFDDLQRGATKLAGEIAGLEVLRVINEPTAAALAYGAASKAHERLVVYDLGGGTFDVTLLEADGSVFEVLGTGGNTQLGGDDIDIAVADRMAEDILKKHKVDARKDPHEYGRLRVLAEKLKRELSAKPEGEVIDDLFLVKGKPAVRWSFKMGRPELEKLALITIETTFRVCREVLRTAKMDPQEVGRVILVGGATRMPLVQNRVEQFFHKKPVCTINPDEVVSMGAALQAAQLEPLEKQRPATAAVPGMVPGMIGGFELPDALPSEDDWGSPAGADPLAAAGGLPLPEPFPSEFPALPNVPDEAGQEGAPTMMLRAAKPVAAEPIDFALPLDDLPPPPAPVEAGPEPGLPPSGAQARKLGVPPPLRKKPAAPPQAAPPAISQADREKNMADELLKMMSASRPSTVLIDVTPLALGVETVGGHCDVLIRANTPVPCDRTRTFATAVDAQTSVSVRVAQGPSARFAENTCLGSVELAGIEPAPRGERKIAVTFEIDADGILNVRARDVSSGKQTTARIQLVGGPTDAKEVEAMRARQEALPIADLAAQPPAGAGAAPRQ